MGHRNNKISYRKKSQGILIQDNVRSVETQTDELTTTHDDFAYLQKELTEFKRATQNEILLLKTHASCNNNHVGSVGIKEKRKVT